MQPSLIPSLRFFVPLISILAFWIGCTPAYAEETATDTIDIAAIDIVSNNENSQATDTSYLLSGDVDGNGYLDLIVGTTSNKTFVYITEENEVGDVRIRQIAMLPGPDEIEATTAALGDLNNDGALDLVLGYDGAPDQIYLNVNGTGNFTPKLTLSDVNSKTVSIALGDVDGNGELDVVVAKKCGSNPIYLNVFGKQPEKRIFGDLPCNETSRATAVALGDLNKNGKLDIVIGVYGAQSQVYINDGNGNFPNPPLPFGEILRTTSIALGDLNDDRALDIVVGNALQIIDNGKDITGTNEIYLNSQNGEIIITKPITFGAHSEQGKIEDIDNTTSVAIADIDGEGIFEIIVGTETVTTEQGGVKSRASRIYCQGRDENNKLIYSSCIGTFKSNDKTQSIVIADMDGSGDLNIVASNANVESNTDPFTVFDGISVPVYPVSLLDSIVDNSIDNPSGVVLGDLDGDDHLDIVINHATGNQIYLNNHDKKLGAFSKHGTIGGAGATSIALGDLNDDNTLDIVVLHQSPPYEVCLNNGQAQFSCSMGSIPFDASSPAPASSVVTGDLDGDGDLDLVIGYDGKLGQVYRNKRSKGDTPGGLVSFEFAPSLPRNDVTSSNTVTRTKSLALGDLNNDEALDLVVGNRGQSVVYLNINDGSATFSGPYPVGKVGDTFSVMVGDVGGNGVLDIIISNEKREPNFIHLNQGDGINYTSNPVFDSGGTYPIALGALEGDKTPDIVFGNDFIYSFRKDLIISLPSIILPTLGLLPPLENGGVAVGDLNEDGLLDLVISGNVYDRNSPNIHFVPGVIYQNTTRSARGLVNTAASIHIKRPGSTAEANFYSTPEILSGLKVAIDYTLYDPEKDFVGQVFGYYSLDGGGEWQPATPTTDTITTTLQTDVYPNSNGNQHTYFWNIQEIFGQPNNVVFRLVAYPQAPPYKTEDRKYSYMDGVAGPYQWPYAPSVTFPFRLRGTQVLVQECKNGRQSCTGVPNALVYRLSPGNILAEPIPDRRHPLRTDQQGYLRGRASIGPDDVLMALWPVASVNGNDYIPFTDKYSLYYTSGELKPLIDNQPLTVSADNKLLLFHLGVSLEWDARQDTLYLDQLKLDLQRVSQYLYDWTNGQMALGQVNLYFNGQKWDDADVRIYASNRLHPNANQGGIVAQEYVLPGTQERYDHGRVRIGAIWNRYGNASGSLGEDWPKALAHELGHYLLFLDDNYFGFDDAGHFVPVRDCRGAMFDPYRESESEFYPDNSVPSVLIEWQRDCANTFSDYSTGRSDWATIGKVYPGLSIPTVTYSDVIPGPSLRLDVTHIEENPLDTPSTAIKTPIFNLIEGGKSVVDSRRMRAFLFQDNRLIDLGRPIAGQVLARGSRKLDRLCVFELEGKNAQSKSRLGCEVIQEGDTLQLRETIGKWPPEVRIHPGDGKNITVEVRGPISGTAGGIVLKARLYPDNLNLPVIERIMTLTQDTYVANFSGYAETVSAAYVHIWVEEPGSRRETVTNFALGGGPGFKHDISEQAPAVSTDGQALLYVTKSNLLAEGDFFSLQAITVISDAPLWTTPVGHAYRLIASRETLLTPSATNPITGTLILNYLESEVPDGSERWLTMYYKKDKEYTDPWVPITDTTVITDRNYVAAPVKGPGLYAIMSTVVITLDQGWNIFAYMGQNDGNVQQALASISTKYTVVWGYDESLSPKPWLHYDPTVPVRFQNKVNNLRELEFDRGYWIYAKEPIILYLKGDTNTLVAAAGQPLLPPTIFYGATLAASDFTPAVGMEVTAWISGKLCGQTQVEDMNGQLGYVLDIPADLGGATTGCGVSGRIVEFKVNGVPMIVKSVWDNTRAQYTHLVSKFDYHYFLPIVDR